MNLRTLFSAIVGVMYTIGLLRSAAFTASFQQDRVHLLNAQTTIENHMTLAVGRAVNCGELRRIGRRLYEQFDFVGSLSHYERALRCYRDAHDLKEEGITLNHIGVLYDAQGRFEDALVQYEAALALARQVGNRASEGTTLGNIGGVYHDQGRYEDALANHKAALAIQREVGDREGEGYTLNNMGQVYDSLGHNEDALLQHEAALVIWREIGDRANEGRTLSSIGGIYFDQGRFDDALSQYRAALAIVREVGDRRSEGAILHNIGLVHGVQGRYEDALREYESALAIARQIGNRLSERTTLDSIGGVYLDQGRYEDALAHYEAALAIAREVGERAGEGTSLNNMGVVYEAQGNNEDALIHYDAALSIWREVGSREGEAATLHNIGQVYSTYGRKEDALRQYEASLAIRRAVGDRRGEAATLNNIANVYRVQGRYEDALAQYEAALAIIREVDVRADEGAIRDNIGQVYTAQGLYEGALAQYESALTIQREIGDRAGEAVTLNNIGQVYGEQGNNENALVQYQMALVILRDIGDRKGEGRTLSNIGGVYREQERYEDALASYEAGLTIAREVGDREIEGSILNNVGLVYYTQGRNEEALAQYNAALALAREVGDRLDEEVALNNIGIVFAAQGRHEDALAQYEAALALVESIRTTAGNEQARMGFVAQYEFLFENTIDFNLRRARATEAFFTSERARARAFLDSLATGYVQLDNQELDRLIGNEESAYLARQTLQDELVRARSQEPVDEQLVATLQSDLAEAQAAYDAAVEAIVARGDRISSLIPGRSLDYVLGVDEVQAALPADTTLVSYFLYRDHDNEEQAVAFVLTQDGFETVSLPAGEEEMRAALERFRSFTSTSGAHTEALQQLYTWLVEPFAKELRTTNLIIVPHSILNYLPFAALTDGTQYLGERYIITTLPSASTLPLLAQNKPGEATALVLGNPNTDANLANLLAAEVETKAIAGLYNQPAYTGVAATESLVLKQAGLHNVLHIASHAEFNAVAPLQSRLYLAADDVNDGLLHMDEVYGMDLTATDLVVLSACQTNVGNVSPGDDIVALNRAFLFAGAPTVIASLWNVDDVATSTLMTRFYTYLNDGWGKAEALRQAQIDLRTEHTEYEHPFFWAAFVLSGDGGEPSHSGIVGLADHGSRLWIGATIPLVLILVVVRRKWQMRTRQEGGSDRGKEWGDKLRETDGRFM